MRSRRDLRIINAVMGNRGWCRRALASVVRTGERVLELGAGTGEQGTYLRRRGIAVDGLDLWPRPPGWPGDAAWHQADLTAFGGYGSYDVVLGNLILHQFTDEALGALGAALRPHVRAVIACEPARRRRSQRMMAAFAPLLGASPVTLHDARVSIAAGFDGDELPRLLGLSQPQWSARCTLTAIGAYRMIAERRG